MQNQTIVIVGATGGIGSALVQKLAPTGANLVFAAKDSQKLDQLVSKFLLRVRY